MQTDSNSLDTLTVHLKPQMPGAAYRIMLRALLPLVCFLSVTGTIRADDLPAIPIVDCHVHLWDTGRTEGIRWIARDDEVLFRSFLPKHHEPLAEANGVKSVVVVQAGQSLPDNQWNLDVTAHNRGLYKGVVGNLSKVIGTDGFGPLFDKLCQDERYVGYRLSGRYQETLSDEFFRDLEHTAEMGKSVDFLLGGYSLEDVVVIAERVPELRIILDHFGNLNLDGEPLDPAWVEKMRAAAQHPNVYCKVSALYGRAQEQPAPQDIDFYKPVLDLVFECFGEDRLVFGSDWPVTERSGDYASVLSLTRAYFDARGREVLEKLFHTNAVRFYKIPGGDEAGTLKLHGIFRSNMVLQRGKPIKIWGWATPGSQVSATFGGTESTASAEADAGRWELTFPARQANPVGQKLMVRAGGEAIELDELLIGDIWVMNGQSNMAFALKAVYDGNFEASMAHLPLLRHIRINAGAESEYVETDLKDEFINMQDPDKDWKIVTPEVALEMGAIGYVFGSCLQRSLQIPIGIIDNARGGASLESLVPRHKFADHPMSAEYLQWVDARRSEFSEEAFLEAQMEKWEVAEEKYQMAVAEDRAKGVEKKRRRPKKPDGSIRTWSVPGRSPSDAAACYNGMFGVFKGLNIKGVAFHQGYNNAMMNTSCKPAFYRILMKLMVEGWREDFNDPRLPIAVIGLCAGGQAQTGLNFEQMGLSPGAYIRESQRLGLADVGDPEHTVFIPAYDLRIPQLHTKKKRELGLRTARWALNSVYGDEGIRWESAKLLSATQDGGKMLLSFDQPVLPDDFGSELEGFSIAGQSGVFYMADAVTAEVADKAQKNRQIIVSSPLVSDPVAVRYAWARAPMGNLKVNGIPWLPLQSFRTDEGTFPGEVSHQDPEGQKKNSEAIKAMKNEASLAQQRRMDPPTSD